MRLPTKHYLKGQAEIEYLVLVFAEGAVLFGDRHLSSSEEVVCKTCAHVTRFYTTETVF